MVFALPYFLWVKGDAYVEKKAKRNLRDLFRTAWNIDGLVQFSIARMLIADALATTFAFGGILASTEFGFSSQDVLVFGLSMNIAAGSGALALSFLCGKQDDYKLTVAYTIGLLLAGIAITLAPNSRDFWLAGLALSFFIGPVQASSRTVYAKLCPEDHRAELFGLFIFSGKATAFIGPALYTSFIYYGNSTRLGMLAVVLLVAIALVLLLSNQALWKPEKDPLIECAQAP
jgi:UMF1 family MFS transporter